MHLACVFPLFPSIFHELKLILNTLKLLNRALTLLNLPPSISFVQSRATIKCSKSLKLSLYEVDDVLLKRQGGTI